jgi:hypothetical protein
MGECESRGKPLWFASYLFAELFSHKIKGLGMRTELLVRMRTKLLVRGTFPNDNKG